MSPGHPVICDPEYLAGVRHGNRLDGAVKQGKPERHGPVLRPGVPVVETFSLHHT